MGCILPVLAGLLALSPAGRSLALLSYDLLFLFRPAAERADVSDVVILVMDEESREALAQDPNKQWDRGVHSRLMRELAAQRAKVVAFDVLFDEPSPDPKADQEFGDALRTHGGAVLAMVVRTSRSEGQPPSWRILRPVNAIGSNVLWGIVELPLEPGSPAIVRRHSNFVNLTNLAWQAAVLFGKAPRDRLTPRWLNHYGPAGTLPTVSYYRALATNLLAPDFFAGKTVFVGKSGLITADGQILDRYPTPFSRWHASQTPGVELQATAFLNLVRGEWLEELPPVAEFLLVILFGTLLGWGLQKLPPWKAAAAALLGAALVAGLFIALARGTHRWFPWLTVSAVQIPCALVGAVLLHTLRLTREKEALEKDVALAESFASLPELLGESSPGSTRRAGPADALPPIPNHQLIRRIGRGAYGEVWLARDEIGTYHAVKVVYQRTFDSAAPYEREFRGIQKFTPLSRSHPGFVNILHVGRNDPEGYFFYIMELGDDEHCGQRIDPATYSPNTLARQLEVRGRLPLAECLQLGLDLTSALEYLHQQKLIHRDIKPSNIIFVSRAPKFADVGLVTDITPHKKGATFVGTEGYLAPEGPGTPAADIYSLGKVLYQACTGRDCHEFPSLSGTLLAAGDEHLSALNEIILKACHAETEHRYQSAAAMHADLAVVRQRLIGNKSLNGSEP